MSILVKYIQQFTGILTRNLFSDKYVSITTDHRDILVILHPKR